MQEAFIILAALIASLLTLISGFGLGTLLLPVFALFFPLELAVAMTAVVHLLNNVFKTGLLWKKADLGVVLRFGVPGVMGAWFGARALMMLGDRPDMYTGYYGPVGYTQFVIGILMLVFAVFELMPARKRWSLPRSFLIPGGALSGFFGGLSGHQGALRSIFLLHCGLDGPSFIATGVVIAILVDLVRIPVYLSKMPVDLLYAQATILTMATVAAFLGAWLGKMLIPKVTMRGVQMIVGALLILIAAGMLSGAI